MGLYWVCLIASLNSAGMDHALLGASHRVPAPSKCLIIWGKPNRLLFKTQMKWERSKKKGTKDLQSTE